jgi:hypothetical protein
MKVRNIIMLVSERFIGGQANKGFKNKKNIHLCRGHAFCGR